MEKTNLTAIILAKNEEEKIARAVESVSFCKHVIVADDSSTDHTVPNAQDRHAEILRLPETDDFSQKRSYVLEKSPTDWVLFIDADEVVTAELADEIRDELKKNKSGITAYNLKRRDFWWGRELRYGETLKARTNGICRLINRNNGKWNGSVHEVWVTEGKTGSLRNYLNHYPHPSLKEFVTDINTYSTRRARELHDQGHRFRAFELWCLPLFKFVLTYVVYLGFLDGAAGFGYSFLMSFHSFLVRAKLYQYSKLTDK